jgi:ribosomal protein S27E
MTPSDDGNDTNGSEEKRTRFVSFQCRACKRTVESWGHDTHVACENCSTAQEVPSHLRRD